MRLAKKTLSYSVIHLIVATSVAYALTGDIVIALSIGLIEPAVQTIAYALHEMAWEGKFHLRLHHHTSTYSNST